VVAVRFRRGEHGLGLKVNRYFRPSVTLINV
jgi:hypothetical protein